jgi:phosphoenolpyruvate-protein kinase (PTS system EI component)
LEAAHLRAAVEATAAELSVLASRTDPLAGADIAQIVETQALMARDPAIIEPALEAVARGMSAHEAVLLAATRQSEQLAALPDPYFRARAVDVMDVARRIAGRLGGAQLATLWPADGMPAVLIAEDLGPAETASLQPQQVAGIALAGGALVGHAAIIARALGLPLVLGLGGSILEVTPDAVVLVDGSAGRVLIDPSDREIHSSVPVP